MIWRRSEDPVLFSTEQKSNDTTYEEFVKREGFKSGKRGPEWLNNENQSIIGSRDAVPISMLLVPLSLYS